MHQNPKHAFRLREFVSAVIDKAVDPDTFDEVNGRLEVAVTNLPGCSARRVREFRSVEHLKTALLSSACMTPLAGLPIKLDGQWCFDGGVADFQPDFHDNGGNTVTISPFYFSRADIKPSKFVPAWWALYPPRLEELDRLFTLGRVDALEWLERRGLTRSQTPPPNTPLASPPRSPAVQRKSAVAAPGAVAIQVESDAGVVMEAAAKKLAGVDGAMVGEDDEVVPEPHLHFNVRHRPSPKGRLKARLGASVLLPETPLEPLETGVLDLLVLVLMFVVIKPIAFTLLYLELIGRAAFHICTGAWQDWYQVTRSAVSGRMIARAIVGRSVPMNTDRLEKHSFIYRFFSYHL